jgi:hypothetical protein
LILGDDNGWIAISGILEQPFESRGLTVPHRVGNVFCLALELVNDSATVSEAADVHA